MATIMAPIATSALQDMDIDMDVDPGPMGELEEYEIVRFEHLFESVG